MTFPNFTACKRQQVNAHNSQSEATPVCTKHYFVSHGCKTGLAGQVPRSSPSCPGVFQVRSQSPQYLEKPDGPIPFKCLQGTAVSRDWKFNFTMTFLRIKLFTNLITPMQSRICSKVQVLQNQNLEESQLHPWGLSHQIQTRLLVPHFVPAGRFQGSRASQI